MHTGFFVVLEGIDGSGKGTQLKRIKKELAGKGITVQVRSSPNEDTATGRMVRRRLKRGVKMSMYDLQQMYSEDKLLTYVRCISPAVQRGEIVLGDRWNWSFWAYGSLELTEKELTEIYEQTFRHINVEPQFYVFLDVSVDEAVRRLNAAGDERQLFEHRDMLEKVHARYQKLIKSRPEKAVVIDGELPPETITVLILKGIKTFIKGGKVRTSC